MQRNTRGTKSLSALSKADRKKGTLEKSDSKVSFNETMTKTIVVESGDFQNASWYSKDDIKDFRKQLNELKLEGIGTSSATTIRKDVIRSILRTQSEHKAMGISDPKGLRQLSRACSKKAIANAITRAQQELSDDSWQEPNRTVAEADTTESPAMSRVPSNAYGFFDPIES